MTDRTIVEAFDLGLDAEAKRAKRLSVLRRINLHAGVEQTVTFRKRSDRTMRTMTFKTFGGGGFSWQAYGVLAVREIVVDETTGEVREQGRSVNLDGVYYLDVTGRRYDWTAGVEPVETAIPTGRSLADVRRDIDRFFPQ